MTGVRAKVSDEVDAFDRQIIHAIQLYPRAPFALVAQALGVSEQTVARRYRRMEGSGLLRVLGLSSPEALGYERWMLRIQCRPDAAGSIAEALARREDVSWVSLAAGGCEIICQTRMRQDHSTQDLLLHRLPRTAEVNGLSAFSVLHEFDPAAEWSGYGGELDPAQIAMLTPPVPVGACEPAPATPTAPAVRKTTPSATAPATPAPVNAGLLIDAEDDRLLGALSRDGRASLRRLSEHTGWSAARVSRRIDTLQASGALYFDVDLDTIRLGFTTTAMLWMTVSPHDLADVGNALTTHDEVAFCAAVTGSASLVASVVCRNPADLYRYLTTRISALPAVRQLETSPLVRRVKQAGSILTTTGIARPTPV
jgi:DNA-binding Lrp family transcriptional regulator